jgi:cobalt-zinc-cadmium efflux system membrane fusion protein
MKRVVYILIVILAASCLTGDKGQIEDCAITADSLANNILPQSFRGRGYLYLPPDRLATVTAPMAGFIKKMYYSTGDYVKKGRLLAVLKHQDYIKIQKDYLEAKSMLDYYDEDFKRQGDLTLDHATSIKKMQKAQADYWSVEAKLRALEAQLKFIGIDPEKVKNTGFTSSISIYAPVNGYITKVEGNIGKFVDSYGFIYEIADIGNLLVRFELPDSLFNKVAGDMPLTYAVSSAKKEYLSARIKNIGQIIDTESGCFSVFAQPDSNICSFRPGMTVEVNLILE